MKIKIAKCNQCGSRVLEVTRKIKQGIRIDYKCRKCDILSTQYMWFKD